MSVGVVLASYNGERFIEAQIQSIQNNLGYEELVTEFLVVDDGSTDNTERIVSAMSAADPKIKFIPNTTKKPLGPMANFNRGLMQSTADVIFLADQDDIWRPHKLQRMLRAYKPTNQPFAMFSDLTVVNHDLSTLNHSYFALKHIPKDWHESFDNLLQQNVASGCAMMVNRALIQQACPIPVGAYMHDWWLMLVAKSHGDVVFIDEPLTLYRQHTSNAIGARGRALKDYTTQFGLTYRNLKRSFTKVCEQSAAFKRAFPHTQRSATLNALTQFKQIGRYSRLQALRQRKIYRSTKLATFGMYLLAVDLPRKKEVN